MTYAYRVPCVRAEARPSRAFLCAAFLPAVIVLLVIAFGGIAFAEDEPAMVVRAKGRADGVGLAARQQAIADAQHAAVQTVLESWVYFEDLSPFRQLLRHATGYVARYDVLRVDAENALTRVEIDAEIDVGPLRHDVSTIMLPRLPRKPSILLVVGEKIGDDRIVAIPDAGAVESRLTEGLDQLGFEVQGSRALEKVYDHAALVGVVTGDVAEGRKFALENLADVVAIGTGVATPESTPVPGNVLRNVAELNFKIFRGADGRMTDAVHTRAIVESVDPNVGGELAVRDAAAKALRDISVAAVMAVLEVQAPDRILIIAESPGSEAALEKLAAHCALLPGVIEVRTLLSTPKLGRLHLDCAGTMAPLVDNLDGQAIGQRVLEVRRAVGREIVVAFKMPALFSPSPPSPAARCTE